MANKNLFKTVAGKLLPKTDALNEHLAPAYALSPKAQLAQYAATGCLNHTFYADADEHRVGHVAIEFGRDEDAGDRRTLMHRRRKLLQPNSRATPRRVGIRHGR